VNEVMEQKPQRLQMGCEEEAKGSEYSKGGWGVQSTARNRQKYRKFGK